LTPFQRRVAALDNNGVDIHAITRLTNRTHEDVRAALDVFETRTAAAVQQKDRKCLKCRKPFVSTHFGHRICNPCRQSNERAAAGFDT